MALSPSSKARLIRRSKRTIKWLAVLGLLLLALGNKWVINNTDDYVFTNWALMPSNEVGLVLGTSPFTRDGQPNPHFTGRIQAAAELYQLGKVKHLIVSGANPDAHYNEPRRMLKALVAAGVPASAITMDFAGFRTFDSVARAKRVFGLTQVTIITQQYLAYRAVFIGKKMKMQPIAYAPAGEQSGPAFLPYARETLARLMAIFDLFVLNTAPKFTGDPEKLPIEEEALPPDSLDTPAAPDGPST